MHFFLGRILSVLLILAMIIGILPTAFAYEPSAAQESEAPTRASNVVAVVNDDLTFSDEEILGYWINPSNFTVSETNILNLTNRGVTDFYVLVKGEAGSYNTTALKNVIAYAPSSVRVHAWVMCARDNSYIKSNPTHAVYHFRFGLKNNAHSTSSSYYADRNGYVDLRNKSYQSYFNGVVDKLEAISGLDGIHLDTIRYGGDYYDWSTNLKNALGVNDYNTLAKAMCAHHGYTCAKDSSGYYAFSATTSADDASLANLVNANGSAAKKYIDYRTGTITGFIKSVKENLDSDMILTAAFMPEPAITLYGKSTYGQDFAGAAKYLDYVTVMSYFGDYYFVNNNTYDKAWPAELCKSIAKEGCNVVAGIQGYAFVNTDSARNGLNPTGVESRQQAEYLHDARRLVNGDPTYGGDILGAAVFRTGTCAQAIITYNKTDRTVTVKFVAGDTAVKSYRIDLYNGFYIDKSRCTVDSSSGTYTYNGTTYYYGGTESNGYYPRVGYTVSVAKYGTKSITIPVCSNTGGEVTTSYNNNHFAAISIYNSTTKSDSTQLPIYLDSYVDSTHTSCTFTKTTPQPATCTSAGYNLYTCKTCAYDYAEYIAPTAHDYQATVTPPTCEAQGYTTYRCVNGCGDSYVEDYVDALGHTYEEVLIVPSCSSQGYTEYTCINGCGDTYRDNYVDALEHTYDDGVITRQATCLVDGEKLFTCTACSYTYTEAVKAEGHGETTQVTVDATCDKEGAINEVCSLCGEILASEPIEALGHTYVETSTEPTCTEPGGTFHTCSVCGDTYGDQVPALGHSYDEGEVTTEPTCTLEGVKTFTCTVCDATKTEPIEALGHGETTVSVTNATCTQEGAVKTTCNVCGDVVKIDVILALGHEYDSVVTAPTCTEAGYTTFTCSVCDHSYIGEETPATGHIKTTETVQEATCTENGFVNVSCDACGELLSSTPMAAFGHSYEETVIAPTCVDGGYTEHTCSICEDSYRSDETEALGHSYTSVVTEPTCETIGYTTHTCEVCNDTYVDAEVPANGHSKIYEPLEENHKTTCEHCDYEAIEEHEIEGFYCIWCEAFVCDHSETSVIVDIEATCLEEGTQRIVCKACETEIAVETIAAKGHQLTYAEAKQPTCTESGNRSYYKCDACHSYFTDETCSYEIPESFAIKQPKGHSSSYHDNGDGTHDYLCDTCGAVEIDDEKHTFTDGLCICEAEESTEPTYILKPELTFAMNISVGADMKVVYTIYQKTIVNYTDFYLVVDKITADGQRISTTYGSADGMIDFATTIVPTTGAAYMHRATFADIYAREMGDVFEATLYAVAADGTIHYSKTNASSIKSYLMQKLNDAEALDSLKTLAVDMLNYGAAAQKYFGYDVAHLVNADLTSTQLAYATKVTPEAINSSKTEGDGLALTGNVSLKAKVILNLTCRYTPENAENLKYVICDAADGKVIAELPVSVINNVLCRATYDEVGAKQMRRVITATLYDGDQAVSKTLTWSVESYVASMRDSAAATAEQIAMVNAMLIYGDSAAVYLTESAQ